MYWYFRTWKKDGTLDRLHDELRGDLRQAEGRHRQPSAAIIDSQSVKTTEKGGPRGYDAGKKVNGRKRHILVDTLGLILAVVVHPADVQDRDGAKLVLGLIRGRFSRLRLIWADGGYAGQLVEWVRAPAAARDRLRLEIVKRSDDATGSRSLPRRWVVERTFAWLGRCRRLSKDYEETTASSEAFVKLAMIHLMVRRLARKTKGKIAFPTGSERIVGRSTGINGGWGKTPAECVSPIIVLVACAVVRDQPMASMTRRADARSLSA